jgi:hypothetical protein
MTMASSGSINLVGVSSSPQRSIAAELGVSAPLSLRTTNVLLLANRSTSQSVIMPDHFWGMTKRTYPAEWSGQTYSDTSDPGNGQYGAGVNMNFYTDGTWDAVPLVSFGGGSGNWSAPTLATVGRLYWIRWTRTSLSGTGSYSAAASSGWQNVTSTLTIAVTASGSPGVGASVTASYTIDIATDSGGSNVVSSTSVTLSAVALIG